MYKIMIYINTYSGDKWFYYQENKKDYVAHSLHEIKETVLTLIDTYGKDNIKIVKQVTGEDMEGSVETFIYDSTDNYEELVNRPSINGVEIIGALSLAELGIQPAGDYATNAKVGELEQAVNNIDLSPYATNTRVDQVEHKVDNIDLTPYATNERVDQVEAKVDAIDLEPYATMDYLDEVVANIDFSSTNEEISGIKTFSVLPRSTVMPVTEDELTNKSYVDHGVENCASKEYVDTAISNIEIPEVNLDGYATTEYVDNAIANIDIPEETTETVIFSSADTKEQRKAKFFHLVNLYDSGKKFNAFFKCNAGVSVLGTSFKPDMPIYGFLYSLSFARGGSYNYKYSMSFLVKYADGSMQSVGDGFAKIELFSKSNDPTQDYNEQCVSVSDEHCYYLPRKHELVTKDYVENYGIKTLSGSIPFTNLDPGNSTWATYYTKTETTITGVPTLGKHVIPAGKVVYVGHYNTEPMTTAGGLWYWTTVGTAKGFGIANGIGSLIDYTTLAYSSTPTIKNQWTFNVIPKTEVEPTNDAHLVNKKYVDDAIAAIEIPEAGGSDIDLSNILTKDNTEEFTPDGDYEPATKKYVDDENKGLVILEKLNFGAQPGNGYGITDEVILNKILNGMLKGGNYYPAFLGVGVSGKQVLFTFVSSYTSNQYKSFTYMGTTTLGEKTNTSEVHKLTFTINGMGYMSSDTKTISNVNTSFSHINRSLNTDNTISYTPTSDYHPSTKKYVDDSIAAIDIPTGNTNAIEQVETLPTGSEELVGTVYQYIGATNTSYGYVHGNYYICTKKMYLNRHNDRFTTYPWVNAQYENIVKEIPMHEYRNTSGVNFLTPGEHQVWGGTTFDVASDLSKILKRYTSDYNTALFLYSERLTSDTQEYVSVLFTVSYNTIIDNVEYQVFEGITHSIKNPGKTAHVILRTATNGFNDYSCSPVFIVTERSGANLDNYYTKEEVDAAIAAAITGALEGEY